MQTLVTSYPGLTLVAPDPSRDAPYAVRWFMGEEGKRTLQRMGNADDQITPTTPEKERRTLEQFLELEAAGKQQTWMMRLRQETVGAVWVEYETTPQLPAPAISIMVGDPTLRGKGMGTAAMRSVITYLKDRGITKLYARHLVDNEASAHLLHDIGFRPLGSAYEDSGLHFQNVQLVISRQ